MNIFILIIFLQIILESLPVSSSGHLVLLSKLVTLNFPEQIDYFLHGPTIIILMVVFYKQWFFPVSRLVKGFFNKVWILKQVQNDKKDKKVFPRVILNLFQDPVIRFPSNSSYKKLFKIFFKIIKLIFVANLITTTIWFLIKTFLEKQSWFTSDITLLFGFCVTAVFLFSLRRGLKREFYVNNISKFIILGFVQGLALLPGISRFASVYATARLLKIPTRRAFEITFLLQFPLIVAGFFLGFYKMSRVPGWYNIFSLPVVLSIVVATIVSVFVLFWCKRLARDKKLWRFSFYMFFPISILILFFVF